MNWTDLLLLQCAFVIRLRLAEQEQVLRRGTYETRTYPWLISIGDDVVIDYQLLDRMRLNQRLASPVRRCASGGNSGAADYTGQAEIELP